VLVHYIFLYQVARGLQTENLVLKIWFLITQEKCAGLCKNIAKTQLARYFWASASVFKFGVPFTPQLLQSARNITPSWGTPKAGMYHIITMLWDSQHCLSEYPLHHQKFACSYIFDRKIAFYQTQVNSVYSRAIHVESNLVNLLQLGQWFWNALECRTVTALSMESM